MEDLGKYILIVSNNNYSYTSKKLKELLVYLDKEKVTLLTMKLV